MGRGEGSTEELNGLGMPSGEASQIDEGWRTRVPFFLAPNGAFSMGNVGDEHWEIPDDGAVNSGIHEWFVETYPEWAAEGPDGEVWRDHQGQVNIDPESGEMAVVWPLNWETLQPKEWLTPEMRQAVLGEAQRRWQEQGPCLDEDPGKDSSLGSDSRFAAGA